MSKSQAKAPAPQFFGAEAFQSQENTTGRWLAGAGALINCRDLAPVCDSCHAPRYVAGLAAKLGLPSTGHEINDTFSVGPLNVTLTPADHAWQNAFPRAADRVFQKEDFCGFWLDTPDGTIS